MGHEIPSGHSLFVNLKIILYFEELKQDRFWPYFKGAIGAIDGSHIKNVLVICDFDMRFTFEEIIIARFVLHNFICDSQPSNVEDQSQDGGHEHTVLLNFGDGPNKQHSRYCELEYIRVLLCLFSAFYCVSCNQLSEHARPSSPSWQLKIPLHRVGSARLPLKKDNSVAVTCILTNIILMDCSFFTKIMFTFPYIFAIIYMCFEI
ncbi:hypothetical protein ACJX0J_024650, partial [Zea mays]